MGLKFQLKDAVVALARAAQQLTRNVGRIAGTKFGAASANNERCHFVIWVGKLCGAINLRVCPKFAGCSEIKLFVIMIVPPQNHFYVAVGRHDIPPRFSCTSI